MWTFTPRYRFIVKDNIFATKRMAKMIITKTELVDMILRKEYAFTWEHYGEHLRFNEDGRYKSNERRKYLATLKGWELWRIFIEVIYAD